MALLKLNTNPGDRELRQFAAIWFPAMCAVFAALAYFRWDAPNVAWGFGIAAVVVAVVGSMFPKAIAPLFVVLMIVTFPIGFVVSHILVGALFFLLITPLGWALRLFGHDPLALRRDGTSETYWLPHRQRKDLSSYFKQY
ncbi:MAG: SxtJ family membrane protein [Pirellulales bacterium]